MKTSSHSVGEKGLIFFTKEEVSSIVEKPARTADLLLLWASTWFGLEMFASVCQRNASPFLSSDGPSLQKEKSDSGFVRHLLVSSYVTEWLQQC